jgi:aspartate-semialdehyde dehydrogenase
VQQRPKIGKISPLFNKRFLAIFNCFLPLPIAAGYSGGGNKFPRNILFKMKDFKVGILGATGAVGQKFIRLLENHLWFTIKALGASKRSSGQSYKKAVHWIEPTKIPETVSDIVVNACEPKDFGDVDFVFSGLDSSVAGEIEGAFAQAGIPVISNAKNYRMDDSVPLLIPEINPDHAELINTQTFDENGNGWIVTNPNCSTVALAMSLKPLYDAFGLKSVVVTTMQAISGGGYPGVPSLDITANVVPFIGGEEDKIESEPNKLLGTFENDAITYADFPIQATATRVPVIEGHLVSVSASLQTNPSNIDEVKQAFTHWKSPIAPLSLPSSPPHPVKYYEEQRFPQPRLHAARENGMQAAVGRLRKGTVMDIGYISMAHNTIRGAAGGAILNAELLAEKGYL